MGPSVTEPPWLQTGDPFGHDHNVIDLCGFNFTKGEVFTFHVSRNNCPAFGNDRNTTALISVRSVIERSDFNDSHVVSLLLIERNPIISYTRSIKLFSSV